VPETPPELLRKGIKTALWFPLNASGKPWGVIILLGNAMTVNPAEKNLIIAVSDLLGGIIETHALQKSARAAAVIEERQRLARGLHDSVTQSLYGLTLLAEAGREYMLEGNRESALHYLERTSETAQQALREMRMLLYELRPPELEQLGLAGALRYRLDAVERRVGLEANFKIKETAPISGEHQEALFWIALEALNNTLKHAHASRVELSLRAGPRRLRLEIADNGQGFDPDNGNNGGMGLVGMRERAKKIGAVLRIESAPGKGTRLSVELDPGAAKKESENE
jgi:signal transduction histidine kinase